MAKQVGILDQVRAAFRNPLALVLTVPFAAALPVAVFWTAHFDVPTETVLWKQVLKVAIVFGGLVFSAKSVFHWMHQMTGEKAKALGFVVLMEGVMVFSASAVVATAALVLLVSINAVAAAAHTAMEDRKANNRRRGARKGARTRAKTATLRAAA